MSKHSDISSTFWLYNVLPASWRPYLMSMRLDRPIGVWLLFLPCMWPLALLGNVWQTAYYGTLFLLGSVLMRGAGCAYNDWVDVDIDQQVERTKGRPLASGQISKTSLAVFIIGLLLVSFGILIQLPWFAVALGVVSLVPVLIYPWMKRFTYWPQAFLGIAFNWGVLISWAAVEGTLSLTTFVLYGVGILWTLVYDTIYAHQDKEDDLKIGVKSTALKLKGSTRLFLNVCTGGMFAGLLFIGTAEGLNAFYYATISVAIAGLLAQSLRLDFDDPAQCLKAFKRQHYVGWVLVVAFLIGRVIS